MKQMVLAAVAILLQFPNCARAAGYSIMDLGISGREAAGATINDLGQTLLGFDPQVYGTPPLALFNDGQQTFNLTSLMTHSGLPASGVINNIGQVLDTFADGVGGS